MKMHTNFTYMRTISANFVLSAMLILSCSTFAQDEVTVKYHSVEDPGKRLISQQNFQLAIAFAFDSKKFNELWPDYGYDFHKIQNSMDDLCKDRNRGDINIGRSAIARNVTRSADAGSSQVQRSTEFLALLIENDTKPDVVYAFLDNRPIQAHAIYHDSEDFPPVTVDSICGIIPKDSSEALKGAVIVTQHPLPIPVRPSYRLLPDGRFADSSWTNSM